uniref:Uncharacterized protein n=1 Tax=Panagrolaimus sp. PS1159 TaxID=55785 RepID=A0AC35G6F5_9BILA
MGGINLLIAFVLLLPHLASFEVILESDQYNVEKSFKFAVTENEGFIENVKIATTIINEMKNIVDLLPENDLASKCKLILKSSGIVGNWICFGYDLYFPQADPMVEKLDKITETFVRKLDEISDKIEKSTQEIKAFIEVKQFEEKVKFPVNQLINHFTMFYTYRTKSLKDKLNHTCKEFTIESIFIDMKSLLDNNAITNQLKYGEYSDAAFEGIESIYKNMMKQLLIAFPICETLVYGEIKDEKELEGRNQHIVKLVEEIEKKLKEENEKRKNIIHQNEMERYYEVTNLRNTVNRFKSIKQLGDNLWHGWEFDGFGKCGESFAILVTEESLKVAVKLFTQKGDSICSFYHNGVASGGWLKENKYWTIKGALEVAREWQNMLRNGGYQSVLNY